MGKKTVNVRRTLVKRYDRFASKSLHACFFLGALALYMLTLLMESLFPLSKDAYAYENSKQRMDRFWFQLPLDVMRWCRLSEGAIRVVLVCGIVGCFGGILGLVWWTRRMKRGVPPAVKLKKVGKG